MSIKKSMLRFALSALLLFSVLTPAKSQLLTWLSFTEGDDSSINDIAGDPVGNTYFLIQFEGVIDVDNLQFNAQSQLDFLIVKRDAADQLQWVRRLTSNNVINCSSIAADSSGSVYVVGSYFAYDSMYVDSGAAGVHVMPIGAYNNGYIVKYDAGGSLAWTKTIDGQYYVNGASYIDLNRARMNGNNLFVTGLVHGNVDMDPSSGTTVIAGGVSGLCALATYDQNGNMVWATQFGSYRNWVNYIAFTPAHDILLAVQMQGSNVDFDPGPGSSQFSSVGVDIFITKLNAGSSYQWTRRVGGNSDQELGGITIANNTNFLICGTTDATFDLDPTSGVCDIVCPSGIRRFCGRYDFNSTFRTGGELSAGIIPGDIFYTANNDIVVYGGTSLAGHYALVYFDTSYATVSYNIYGNICSSRCTFFRFPFTLYIGGHATSNNYYGNDGTQNVYQNSSFSTGFAVKYYLGWGPESVDETSTNDENVAIYPNPAADEFHLTLESAGSQTASILVYDLNGNLITATREQLIEGGVITVSTAAYASGTYMVVCETEAERCVKRLVIVR